MCRTQALVLSPTRELATQTDKTVRALGEFLKLKSHCCIGGKSIGRLPGLLFSCQLHVFETLFKYACSLCRG